MSAASGEPAPQLLHQARLQGCLLPAACCAGWGGRVMLLAGWRMGLLRFPAFKTCNRHRIRSTARKRPSTDSHAPPQICCSWSDRWKRDVLRLVQFEAAFALRDFTAALQHLRSVCARWPHSPVVWNAYAR